MNLFGVAHGKMESPADRQMIALVLQYSSRPEVKMLASDALNPMNEGTSFARLMETHGLNFHSVSEEFKAVQRSVGFIRAARHIPDIMEQTARDAMSRDEKCPKCSGVGGDCKECGGKGTVYVLGNVERLRLMFETFGLTGKGGGVNVNVDLRKVEGSESMASLSESIAPLLEGKVQE